MAATPPLPPGPPGPEPRPRAGEADRERLLVLLREHYAQGQLDLDELSRRVGIVLAATYADETAAAVCDLAPLAVTASGGQAAQAGRGRFGQRRRHGQRAAPEAGWVPTPERFRDPSTRVIVRVWLDPADLSRHYVPEPEA